MGIETAIVVLAVVLVGLLIIGTILGRIPMDTAVKWLLVLLVLCVIAWVLMRVL